MDLGNDKLVQGYWPLPHVQYGLKHASLKLQLLLRSCRLRFFRELQGSCMPFHAVRIAGRVLSSQPSARPGWQPRKSAAKVVAASQQVKRGNEETRNAGTQERRNAGTKERRMSSTRFELGTAALQPHAMTTILRATRTMKDRRKAKYIARPWKTAGPGASGAWAPDCSRVRWERSSRP